MIQIGEQIAALLEAGAQRGPDAFAPAHPRLAPRALRDPAVDHHRSQYPLRGVVGRLYLRVCQEPEEFLGRLTRESFGQPPGQGMIWRGISYVTNYNRRRKLISFT